MKNWQEYGKTYSREARFTATLSVTAYMILARYIFLCTPHGVDKVLHSFVVDEQAMIVIFYGKKFCRTLALVVEVLQLPYDKFMQRIPYNERPTRRMAEYRHPSKIERDYNIIWPPNIPPINEGLRKWAVFQV